MTSLGGSTVAEGPRQTVAYAVLLALAALDASGYSIIAPVAPVVARTTGAGPALVGALVAAFPLGMLLGFAASGQQVARRRTGALLYVAVALVGAGSLGFVLGHTLGVYFAGRILMGIGSGGLWIGITVAMLERWPGQEYLCMSRVFAAYSAGGLVGPMLGAIGGIRGPFLAFALLVCVAFPLVALLGEPRQRRELTADRAALRLPGFWFASAGICFSVLALGVIEGVLPLHFATHLGLTEIGGFYAATSIVIAAAAAGGARFRSQPLLLAAILLVVAGLAVAGVTSAVAVWIAALVCAGVGIGAGNTASTGILLDSVGPQRIVTGLVVWSQLGMVGYLLGPLAGGGVAETLGFGALVIVPLAAAACVVATYFWARSS